LNWNECGVWRQARKEIPGPTRLAVHDFQLRTRRNMNEQLMQTIERMAAASEALESVLARLDAQHEALTSKVDRIVATLDDNSAFQANTDMQKMSARLRELERENADLKAQASRLGRKTLSPLTSALLSKTGGEGATLDVAALDRALAPLSMEQRIAVKAEMARAGMIE
jgi:predicted RNase H-like nuclease (RuvC/YqgF family)